MVGWTWFKALRFGNERSWLVGLMDWLERHLGERCTWLNKLSWFGWMDWG